MSPDGLILQQSDPCDRPWCPVLLLQPTASVSYLWVRGWGWGWGRAYVHGSCPVAEPASHPSGVSPGRVVVQVKHGLPPAVDSQRDTEDPNNVHHYSGLGLRRGGGFRNM